MVPPPITGRSWAAQDDREIARRRIVKLIFLIYWLLIAEGALRKWAFPDLQQYLFFVRDPLVLLVYLYALKKGWWPKASPLLMLGITLGVTAMALVVVGLLQGISAIVLVYGWRNYFLYLPLAFLIGNVFDTFDLYQLVRQTLLIAIPISVLVVFQFLSPASALINAGLIDVYQPGVFGGVVRTYGTFTSTAGQTPFVVSLVALLLATWILPKERRPLGGVLLVLASLAVATCLALSGSRGAFIQTAVVLAVAVVSSFAMRGAAAKARAVLLPIIVVLLAFSLLTTTFAQAGQALLARATGAYAEESTVYAFGTLGRAFSSFGAFGPLLFTTPPLGYGLGTFGNAFGSRSSTTLLPSQVIAEDDWARNIAELGPILGLFYIVLRIALVLSLSRGAIAATRRTNDPMPLLLLSFCGILLLIGQITGQGSVNGIAWLYAGFCMAANHGQASLAVRTELSTSQRRPESGWGTAKVASKPTDVGWGRHK